MFSVQLWYILYDMVLHALTPCPEVPDVAQDPQELTDQIERIQQLMEEEIARLPGELTTSDVEADEMAMGYHENHRKMVV